MKRGGVRNKGKGEKRRGGKQRSSLWPRNEQGWGTRERGGVWLAPISDLEGKKWRNLRIDSFAPADFSLLL